MKYWEEFPRTRTDKYLKFKFQCDSCGNDSFKREEGFEHTSFFEGFFLCEACGKEHNYYSDSFSRVEDQLTLNLK